MALEILLPQIYEHITTQTQILALANHKAADGMIALNHDTHPLAFLLVHRAGPTADIIDIGTSQSARRRGIASLMLQHYIKHMAAEQIDTLFLDVAIDNHPAINLYQKTGFVEIGRRKGYYRRGSGNIDALMMQFRL